MVWEPDSHETAPRQPGDLAAQQLHEASQAADHPQGNQPSIAYVRQFLEKVKRGVSKIQHKKNEFEFRICFSSYILYIFI